MNSRPIFFFFLLLIVLSLLDHLERFFEFAGVGFLREGQGLEPVGEILEPFLAGSSCEPDVHFGVFVGFACDGRFEVIDRGADGIIRRRVSDFFLKGCLYLYLFIYMCVCVSACMCIYFIFGYSGLGRQIDEKKGRFERRIEKREAN